MHAIEFISLPYQTPETGGQHTSKKLARSNPILKMYYVIYVRH